MLDVVLRKRGRDMIEAIFFAAVLILAIAILAVIYRIMRDVPPQS